MRHRYYISVSSLKLLFCCLTFLYAFWLAQKQLFAAETLLFTDDFNSPLSNRWVIKQNKQLASQLPCMNQTQPASWLQELGKITLAIDGPPCFFDLVPKEVDLRNRGSYRLQLTMIPRESLFMDRSVSFFWQDTLNWYNLKIFGSNVVVEKVINGVAHQLASNHSYFPFQLNQPHQVRVEVIPQQQIRVSINGQNIIDLNDELPFFSAQLPQTFSLRGSVGAVSRSVTTIEDVRLTSLLTPTASVDLQTPLYKQHDVRWRNDEYDQAHLWTENPTMSRWGCAVTSMAMILNHYHIDRLPNGQQLTPQTLNNWLKQQPDGYFSGNLNWLAITRLTQQMSGILQTPRLEFSRADGSLQQVLSLAKQEIEASKPVILGYPGHFLVADGTVEETNDLRINDPYFAHQLLSESSSAEKVNTIRRFQPSHTDLSYLLFSLPVDAQITVTNDVGESIETQSLSEFIEDPENHSQSPTHKALLIQKPDTGKYNLSVTQPQVSNLTFTIYHYDVKGNLKSESLSAVVGPEEKNFVVNYQKESVGTASPTPQPTPSATPSPTPHSGWNYQDWYQRQLRKQSKLLLRLEVLLQKLQLHQWLFAPRSYWPGIIWRSPS